MDMQHVDGKDRGHIVIYALSTCPWCRKTKRLFGELGVAYAYVDVDLLEGDERRAAIAEMTRWNEARSFPTVVINDERCIIGFDEEKIREVAAG